MSTKQRAVELHPVMRMPDDMHEAFESMKLAIMHHRFDEWQQFSEDDTLQVLWVLMQVAMDKTMEHPMDRFRRA